MKRYVFNPNDKFSNESEILEALDKEIPMFEKDGFVYTEAGLNNNEYISEVEHEEE